MASHAWCTFAVILMTYFLVIRAESGSWEWSGSGSGSGENQGGSEVEPEEDASSRSTIRANERSATFTFADIVDSSMTMITGKLKDPIKLRKFLNKHFFTDKKSMSIWPKAIEETELMYKFDFSERDLADMQNDLRNIYKNTLVCDEQLEKSRKKKKNLVAHSKCYIGVYEIISSCEVQFGLPPGSDVGQARMLSINIAFNLMKLLFLQMTQNLAMDSGMNPLQITKPIIDTAVILVMYYDRVEQSINATRLASIGPVKVCTKKNVFFKDFDDHCSTEAESFDNLQYAGGSTKALFQRTISVSVTDSVNGKSVCDFKMTSSKLKPKQQIINDMTAKCGKERANYMNKIEKQVQNYLKERTRKIVNALPLLWGRSKKKLKIFSEKLGITLQ